MASLFSKDPTARAPLAPYAIERIEREIAHLRKRSSIRQATIQNFTLARLVTATGLCALLALYFMDPFLYAFHKSDAIRSYLYLHSSGSEQKAQALVSSGILSETEVRNLNRKQGSFQDYFATPQQAEQTADSVVKYMNGLYLLRSGQYEQLDPIGKLRYLLFVRTGLLPPTDWDTLSPSVGDQG